jgi:hypothetical protein
MGASLVYLDKPNKDIQFDFGENSHIKFVAGGMQGWRINMVSLTIHSLNSIITRSKNNMETFW